jgi:hypothetical protein
MLLIQICRVKTVKFYPHSLFWQYWLGGWWGSTIFDFQSPSNLYAVKPEVVDLMEASTTN